MARLTGAGTSQTLQVEGLRQLRRDIKKADASIDKDYIRPALKDIGQIVADEAKSNAQRLFTTLSTGKLASKISPSVTQNAVFVVAKATRAGYGYPGVYEFGGRDVQLTAGGGMTRIRNRSRIGKALRNGGPAQGEFGEYGPNAFLYPALVSKQKDVEQAFEHFLDRFLAGNDL